MSETETTQKCKTHLNKLLNDKEYSLKNEYKLSDYKRNIGYDEVSNKVDNEIDKHIRKIRELKNYKIYKLDMFINHVKNKENINKKINYNLHSWIKDDLKTELESIQQLTKDKETLFDIENKLCDGNLLPSSEIKKIKIQKIISFITGLIILIIVIYYIIEFWSKGVISPYKECKEHEKKLIKFFTDYPEYKDIDENDMYENDYKNYIRYNRLLKEYGINVHDSIEWDNNSISTFEDNDYESLGCGSSLTVHIIMGSLFMIFIGILPVALGIGLIGYGLEKIK